MKIDSSNNHNLSVAKWAGRNNFKDTKQTCFLDTSSNSHYIIEAQQHEVTHFAPHIPIEKDSVQQLKLLYRGLTYKERMVHNRVASIYEYYANISFSDNLSRIDLRI